MRNVSCGIVASMLVVVCGCTQGTPGGPGVKTQPVQSQTVEKPVITNSKEAFSLRLPILSTSLKQGETKSASIEIQRGSEFKNDVTLRFSGIPAGITLNPVAPVIRQSDQETKINVTAANDAALGDFKMKVIGHSEAGGPDAENEFKVTVSAK